MTPLGRILAARIAAEGPMRLDVWMELCLSHPEHGYYATRDPFGTTGDFTTAPEISQMFGEMIGGWLAQVWHDQGSPDTVRLIELGPGRGTLTGDILRAFDRIPALRTATRPCLVETSPVLRRRQAETLAGVDAHWTADLDGVPDGFVLLVANEFLDALPIRQFQRVESAWRERRVMLHDGALAFDLGGLAANPRLDAEFPDAPDGAIVEVGAAGVAVARRIAGRIASHGGAALLIDYGEMHGVGDTLQAVRAHAPVDLLANPGEADLTAHVRFASIAAAAQDLRVSGPEPQGAFLERLGITARAQSLARGRSESEIDAVAGQHRRLTHPREMGTLFKVLALTPATAPQPPGFAP